MSGFAIAAAVGISDVSLCLPQLLFLLGPVNYVLLGVENLKLIICTSVSACIYAHALQIYY